jgi:hypothetical protein
MDRVLLPKIPEEILTGKNFNTVPLHHGNQQARVWLDDSNGEDIQDSWTDASPTTHMPNHFPSDLFPCNLFSVHIPLSPGQLSPLSQVHISTETSSFLCVASLVTLSPALFVFPYAS